MARNLANRVIVITGASSGIGAETAVEAARAGMRIVLAARSDEGLRKVARRCAEAGAEAEVVRTDVADEHAVRRLVGRAVERFGRIDVMLANAGFGAFEDISFGPMNHDADMWRVNYEGTVHCVRAAAEAMKRQGGGHILMTSSIVALTGLPYYATYAATKAAQHALAASLALELEPHGIDVTCVYPSSTATPFHHKSGRLKQTEDPAHANTPQWMVQNPRHVARVIVRSLRRPRAEVWPSRLSRWMVVLWTAWPGFRSFSFRRHAEWTRRRMAEAAADSRTGEAPPSEPTGSDAVPPGERDQRVIPAAKKTKAQASRA